jgi:plasmid segregation protein ParM
MSLSKVHPVVRAIDVGYGHVKYVTRHDMGTGKIQCEGFPSRSPRAQGGDLSSGVMSKMDTVTVAVNGRTYEVGKSVISAAGANDASEILSRDFATSDAYMARLYGALSYMHPHLGGNKIDWLILGLPNLTLNTMSGPLLERVRGEHTINTSGVKIEIENVRIFPQPLGAFFDYGFRSDKLADLRNRVNLIVDPGYNTFDWLLSEGLAPSAARSGSVELGMSAVVRAIAEEILRDNKMEADANLNRVVNRLDYALCNNEEYRLFGKEIDLKKYMSAGDTVVDQAINALEKSVGAGDDIDNIFIAGGGAPIYHKALQARYPRHQVIQISEPQFANVRGFQVVGTNWAHSANRAVVAHA